MGISRCVKPVKYGGVACRALADGAVAVRSFMRIRRWRSGHDENVLNRSRAPSASLSLGTSLVNGGGNRSRRFLPPFAGEVAHTKCATTGAARVDVLEIRSRLSACRGIALLLAALSLCSAASAAPASRPDEGAVPPHFVSLDNNKVYMREGPTYDHRVLWIYRRKGLPVLLTAQFDVWRRVQDFGRRGGLGPFHHDFRCADRFGHFEVAGGAPVRRSPEIEDSGLGSARRYCQAGGLRPASLPSLHRRRRRLDRQEKHLGSNRG